MGSGQFYPPERPVREFQVNRFAIDRGPVTRLPVRPVRRRHRLRDARRAGTRPGSVPGRRSHAAGRRTSRVPADIRPVPLMPPADGGYTSRAPTGVTRGDRRATTPRSTTTCYARRVRGRGRDGPARSCRARRTGSKRREAVSTAPSSRRATSFDRTVSPMPTSAREASRGATPAPWAGGNHPGRPIPARPRPLRHDREHLGVDVGLLLAPRRGRGLSRQLLLYVASPAGPDATREL